MGHLFCHFLLYFDYFVVPLHPVKASETTWSLRKREKARKERTMKQTLLVYNTLHRQKERFEPLHAPNVGM